MYMILPVLSGPVLSALHHYTAVYYLPPVAMLPDSNNRMGRVGWRYNVLIQGDPGGNDLCN